MRHKTLLQE